MAEKKSRRPFPQFNQFRPFVMSELTRRKNQEHFPPVAPFVRLTSCMMEKQLRYAFFTLGLHGLEMGQDLNIFDEVYGSRRDIVGYAYDMNKRQGGKMSKFLVSTDKLTMDGFTKIPYLSEKVSQGQLIRIANDRNVSANTLETAFAAGAHPIPGINDARVSMRGIGQPIVATVQWTCYNQGQLEYLRHHFLTAGNYVVLEWGHQFADKKVRKTLDFADDVKTRKDLANSILQGRKYVTDNFVEPNDGNYNFIVGTVGNFRVDVDARTNVFTCSTTIVGVGEQFYGVSVDTTFVRLGEPNSPKQTSTNTIQDYFKSGMGFDKLINASSNNPKLVAGNFANWGKNNKNVNENATDIKNISFNPEDYRFVSWEFFCKKLIPELISIITHPNAVNDLPRLLNFMPDDETSNDEWVGCNEFLRSCEPDTMLVITSKMDKVSGALQGVGKFDDPKNIFRGQLKQGIWLNAGMIRQCFAEVTNLERAITGLLLRLNNATAGFWGLRLFFDEEIGRYRVVDERYSETKNAPAFWKFNQGSLGECLNIKFDAAFPPELITQMMMYARYKSQTNGVQDDLVKRYPMIGTTSAFVMAVNYTNLIDILRPDVDKVSQNKTVSLDPLDGDTHGARNPDDGTNTRQAAKITNLELEPVPALASGGKNAESGKKLGTISPKLPDLTAQRDNTQVDGSIRSSVRAIEAKKDLGSVETKNLAVLDQDFLSRLHILIERIRLLGYTAKPIETKRSQGRQDYLFTKGRTGDGPIVTKTRRSLHTIGKACDLIILDSRGRDVTQDFYSTLVQLCNQVGLETIGDWDAGHVQVQNGGALTRNASLWTVDTDTGARNKGEVISEASVVPPLSDDGYELPDTNSAVVQRQSDFTNRFGNEIFGVIEVMRSVLLNKISRSGFDTYPNPNAFVFAFPTTTTVVVTLPGVGGISVSDGFYVDKLPFIFERHGVFQCTEITEDITEKGWTTSVRGSFKMLWLEGTERRADPLYNLPARA